jgi:hypothetical protein
MKTRIVLVLTICGLLRAQAPTGQITGVVTDPSGAVIANAAVTLIHTATNGQRQTLTNQDGLFNLVALQPGAYRLEVAAPGFPKQVREGIELQVGQVARTDFTMQIGNVAETVEVRGGAGSATTRSAP